MPTHTLPGTWTPTPGRIVHMASTHDALALAEVPASGQPMRAHVARLEGGALRWEKSWELPWPPTVAPGHDLSESGGWIDAHAAPQGLAVAFGRIEYQGGSHGIALATLRATGWADLSEIESPTDSDIHFGTPLFRRGDTVLTAEDEERLWQFERQGAKCKGTPIALPEGGSVTTEPPMAAKDDGTEFVLRFWRESHGPALAVYRREAGGAFALASEVPMPAEPVSLAYLGDRLYVGFEKPAPDGSLVWALERTAGGAYEAAERKVFPAAEDPTKERLCALAVSADWLLLQMVDGLWAVRRLGTETPRGLELPAGTRAEVQSTRAALVGSAAVVLRGGQLGVFALE